MERPSPMRINPLPALAAMVVGAVSILGWGYLLIITIAPDGAHEKAHAFGVLSVLFAAVGGAAGGVAVHFLRSRHRVVGWIALAAAVITGFVIPLGIVLSF